MVVVMSLWIFTSELECPVLERLSRAPRDRPPQHDRAVPAPHAHRSHRWKNGPQPKNSLRDRNERRKEPSPIPDQLYDVAVTYVVTLCCKLACSVGTHEYQVPGIAHTEQ